MSVLLTMLCLLVSGLAHERIAIVPDPHIMDVEGHPELVKSLDEEVHSTRLFNENIFAFRAALDDVASRGIRTVVIPGDVTDDGQRLNQEAARRILEYYEQHYGMRFFLTPGNHDPKAPFGRHTGSASFLKPDGSVHPISSDPDMMLYGSDVNPDLWSAGLEEQVSCYSDYGYFPREDYLYWETPFSTYTPDDYSFGEALAQSAPEKRLFCYCDSIRVMDTSYLVEPVDGLWLLSIDSGVFLPDGKGSFKGSNPGYNYTLGHKPHLLTWVRRVCREAEERGKTLIAFSHYPLTDFNNGASEYLIRSWGRDKFDIERIPCAAVSDSMALSGLKLHFGGHMHINNTAVWKVGDAVLTNVQVPSVSAAIPAYKILTLKKSGKYRLEDVIVEDVEGFDSLFLLYRKEMEHAGSRGSQVSWSPAILDSRNYAEFCDLYFRDLVRLRFCRNDVPEILQEQMLPYTGAELLARIDADARISRGMSSWTGYDLILDLYRFHYSADLAWRLVSRRRVRQYEKLFDAAQRSTEESEFISQMRDLGMIMNLFIDQDGR